MCKRSQRKLRDCLVEGCLSSWQTWQGMCDPKKWHSERATFLLRKEVLPYCVVVLSSKLCLVGFLVGEEPTESRKPSTNLAKKRAKILGSKRAVSIVVVWCFGCFQACLVFLSGCLLKLSENRLLLSTSYFTLLLLHANVKWLCFTVLHVHVWQMKVYMPEREREQRFWK